jgi:hypothetical protein
VRKAKDNQDVPKRYYRPEQMTCPRCGRTLKRCYPLWRKYVIFLDGRYLVVSMGYRCPKAKCPGHKRVYASQPAEHLTVRGSSFALEVIVQIGYWRFWKRWTVAQIHEVLTRERHLPICEREVLYLIGDFLVLLRSTYPLRLEEHAAYFRRHGLFLSLDALKPEKGNTALYVARELKFGLVLQVVPLLSATHQAVERHVLQPVKTLGYRLRGIVSDDEQALQLAVAHVFPGVRHQTCQSHCLRDAATLIVEADQTFKKALKKAIRTPFYTACRALSQLESEDPCLGVLSTYAELIRSTLTEGSKPPFALGGLRVFEDLTRLEASLRRSREKGGIPSWINCWPWSNAAAPLRLSIAGSNVNATGWSNWIGDWTRPKIAAPGPRHAASSARSRPFWLNWKSTPRRIRTKPAWSRTSAPPSGNAGRGSLPAMLGRNATVPTTTWKPFSVACAPASAKFMDASQCMNLSFAMASGQSSSTRLKLPIRCCAAFNNLTKPSLTKSMPDSEKPNNGSKCCIVFAITLSGVSSN